MHFKNTLQSKWYKLLEKVYIFGKEPDAGKDGRQKKGMTEDEMVGYHYQLDGREFEQALGVGE